MNNQFYAEKFLECNKEQWDKFVNENDEAWFWHTSLFLESWPYGENFSFSIKNNKNEIVLEQVLFFHGKINNQHKYIWHRVISFYNKKNKNTFTSVGGFARRDGLSAKEQRKLSEFYIEYMDNLIDEYNITGFNYSIQATLPKTYWPERNPVINPVIFFGYKNVMSQAYVIDLKQNNDDIFRAYSQTTRNLINKCSKDVNINIVEAQPTLEDMELYYNLHVETYLRTGVNPHPKSYFQHIFFNILPKKICRILFLYNGKTLVAAHNTLLFKDAAIYWTGASITDKGEGESRLLMHKQIMYAKMHGCKYYEVGEAFPNERYGKLKGLNDFKKSFGGFLHPLFAGEYKIY